MTPFRTQRRVEFVDTDLAGIVHFSNFFRYMEAAEVDFLHHLGLSVRLELEGQRLGFPRVSASCDYLRPATFEDILDIEVHLEKIGRKSLTFAFVFSCRGEVVARGRTTSVCCRVAADGRLEAIPLPEVLRQQLQQARTDPQPETDGV
jgi:acyl-CoA thioester hydrolase